MYGCCRYKNYRASIMLKASVCYALAGFLFNNYRDYLWYFLPIKHIFECETEGSITIPKTHQDLAVTAVVEMNLFIMYYQYEENTIKTQLSPVVCNQSVTKTTSPGWSNISLGHNVVMTAYCYEDCGPCALLITETIDQLSLLSCSSIE